MKRARAAKERERGITSSNPICRQWSLERSATTVKRKAVRYINKQRGGKDNEKKKKKKITQSRRRRDVAVGRQSWYHPSCCHKNRASPLHPPTDGRRRHHAKSAADGQPSAQPCNPNEAPHWSRVRCPYPKQNVGYHAAWQPTGSVYRRRGGTSFPATLTAYPRESPANIISRRQWAQRNPAVGDEAKGVACRPTDGRKLKPTGNRIKERKTATS